MLIFPPDVVSLSLSLPAKTDEALKAKERKEEEARKKREEGMPAYPLHPTDTFYPRCTRISSCVLLLAVMAGQG